MSSDSDIVLLCNPAAGGRWKELAGILDADEARFARRVVTDSIDDVGPALVSLSRQAELICIYGGDGTIQRVLDALHRDDATPDLPPLAFIGGGTMNVVARWCGLTRSPRHNFRDVVRAFRRGELSTRQTPLLRVAHGAQVRYGFTFGLGPLVRILERYERGHKGKLAAVAAGLRAISAVWSARPAAWHEAVAETRAAVEIDGEKLPYARFAALFCSVCDEINPTVKPFARTRTADTFYCLAYAVGRREFTLALPLLWRGYLPIDARSLLKPLSTWRQMALSYFGKELVPGDPRYVNRTAKRFTVACDEEIYTVDGELFGSSGDPFEITLGRRLRLAVSPTAELGPVLRLAADIARSAPARIKPE